MTRQIMVGDVPIGGGADVVIQSMLNTKTTDVEGSLAQIRSLAAAGCQKFSLLHLSQENNAPELALEAVADAFRATGFTPAPALTVQAQERNAVSRAMEF